MKRWLFRGLLALLALYAVFVGLLYSAMRRSPMEFSRFMMRLPSPLMYATPFPPLWARARAGNLVNGIEAPDFELDDSRHKEKVRLSSHRGVRPVILVFGSYT